MWWGNIVLGVAMRAATMRGGAGGGHGVGSDPKAADGGVGLRRSGPACSVLRGAARWPGGRGRGRFRLGRGARVRGDAAGLPAGGRLPTARMARPGASAADP